MEYKDTKSTKESVISGVKWIGRLCRDLRFGSIQDVLIRDGAIIRGVKFRQIRTGKPRARGCQGNHDKLDGDDVLYNALHDLHHDTVDCQGEWVIHFKVHKGIPVSWDMEQIGPPSMQDKM